MGIMYYIIKPEKKEMYCTGKSLRFFNGINYICNNINPDYHKYKDFKSFLFDVIQNNDDFMEVIQSESWKNIVKLIHNIWKFISEDKVLLVPDNVFYELEEYREVDSIYDFFKRKIEILDCMENLLNEN